MPRKIFTVIAFTIFCAAVAQSQSPQPSNASLLKDLRAIQEANKALIEKQEKTLQTLDAMKEAAQQIRTLGKRG